MVRIATSLVKGIFGFQASIGVSNGDCLWEMWRRYFLCSISAEGMDTSGVKDAGLWKL